MSDLQLDLSGQRYTVSLIAQFGNVIHEVTVGHFSNALCGVRSAIHQGGKPETIRLSQAGRPLSREEIEVLYLRALR